MPITIPVVTASGVQSTVTLPDPAVTTTPDVQQTLFGAAIPSTLADPDTVSVELATRFIINAAAKAVGVRFYKAPTNTGIHKGYLYAGTSLVASVTFTGETASGWQQALFATPINLTPGTTYTVSYLAPTGRYSSDGSYVWPKTVGPATATGAAYRYGTGGVYPASSFGTANYYADLIFTSDAVVPPPVDPPPVDPPSGDLDLPRVPWEGGPAYWAQFSKAAAAGWASSNFLPIGILPAPFSSAAEVQWDKAHGINTYVGGLNEWCPWDLLAQNGMSYVGSRYSYQGSMMPADYTHLVGYLGEDEIDGTRPPAEGLAWLRQNADAKHALNDGRFVENNFTQMVNLANWFGADYINTPIDAVCMDMYWYTIPGSSYGQSYVSDVRGPVNPRSATSYGAMVRGIRQQDAKDGTRKPVWFFIENLSGSPGEQFVRDITPAELKGATMSCIINEARGIVWFNIVAGAHNNSVGNVIRQAQVNPSFRGRAQVEAMGEVNNQLHRLAPVINTQSYVWDFGPNLETMLKTRDGHAYIFAMCSNGSTPGSRTFTLPTGVTGTTVEVVDEARTLPVSVGKFTDTFAAEYSYHVYKIAL